jgi:polyhydroxybutyrate depolymerase
MFRTHLPIVLLLAGPLLGAGLPFQAARNPLDDYEPPARPQLSGSDTRLTLTVNGRERSLLYYLPKGRKPRALLMVVHGSTGSGRRIRDFTAYKFDQLADREGLVTVYPDGISGVWDDCRMATRRPAQDSALHDAAFLRAAALRVSKEIGSNGLPQFLVGYSGGGHLGLRIALQDPEEFRAYAVFATSLPAPGDLDCTEPTQGVSLLIMNGTMDPINPFEGGEVTPPLGAGLGKVRSTRATAEYFARLAGASGAPSVSRPISGADGTSLEEMMWKGKRHEVELVIVHGGGHSLPDPRAEFPKATGHTSKSASGAELIWSFFARQMP